MKKVLITFTLFVLSVFGQALSGRDHRQARLAEQKRVENLVKERITRAVELRDATAQVAPVPKALFLTINTPVYYFNAASGAIEWVGESTGGAVVSGKFTNFVNPVLAMAPLGPQLFAVDTAGGYWVMTDRQNRGVSDGMNEFANHATTNRIFPLSPNVVFTEDQQNGRLFRTNLVDYSTGQSTSMSRNLPQLGGRIQGTVIAGGQVFWINSETSEVFSAQFDGSNLGTPHLIYPGNMVSTLAVDSTNNLLFIEEGEFCLGMMTPPPSINQSTGNDSNQPETCRAPHLMVGKFGPQGVTGGFTVVDSSLFQYWYSFQNSMVAVDNTLFMTSLVPSVGREPGYYDQVIIRLSYNKDGNAFTAPSVLANLGPDTFVTALTTFKGGL